MSNWLRHPLVIAKQVETLVKKRMEDDQAEMAERMRTMMEPEPEICKQFGCGRKLSPQEMLFGNKCIHHIKKH